MSILVRFFGQSGKMGNRVGGQEGSKSKESSKSKRSSKKADKEREAIVDRLQDLEHILQKKIAFLDSQIDKELANATRHGKKNKRGILCVITLVMIRVFDVQNYSAILQTERRKDNRLEPACFLTVNMLNYFVTEMLACKLSEKNSTLTWISLIILFSFIFFIL